jgi:hypothetical protein
VSKVVLSAGKFRSVEEVRRTAVPDASPDATKTSRAVDAHEKRSKDDAPLVSADAVGRSFTSQLLPLSQASRAVHRLRHPDQDGCGFTGEYVVVIGNRREKVKMDAGYVTTDRPEVRAALEKAGFVLWATEPRW